MRVLDFLGNFLDSILRIVLLIAIVYVIYRGISISYDYGNRIFNETPVSATNGKEITVVIPVDTSAKAMGEMFEEKGLIRDKWLFILQYYASEYREDLKAGTYTLSTSMTVEEMLAVMADTDSEDSTTNSKSESKSDSSQQDAKSDSKDAESDSESGTEAENGSEGASATDKNEGTEN